MTWIEDYAAELEACVANALGELCAWGVVAGSDVSLDYCQGCSGDGCGQWWISVGSIYPTTSFPGPDDTATCATVLGATMEVGIVRCFPVNEDGDPATHEQHAAAFAEQMQDALALHRAISCCQRGWDVRIGVWNPIGPEGGCLGGSWTINVTKA